MNIYIDDERNPQTNKDWKIVRTIEDLNELIKILIKGEKIKEISFDHDLGQEYTGYDLLKLLVSIDMNNTFPIFDDNMICNYHTANPCGRDNMKSYMNSYIKSK